MARLHNRIPASGAVTNSPRECACYAVDLARPRSYLPGNVTPSACCGSDFGDDSRCRPLTKAEVFSGRFDEIKRTGAFVQVNIGGEDTGLDVDRDRIEVKGGCQHPSRLTRPQDPVIAQMVIDV